MPAHKGFNNYRVEGGVVYIEMVSRDGTAVVEALMDAADLPLLLEGKNRCSIGSKNAVDGDVGYVQVYRSGFSGRKLITLHRLLMNPPAGMIVDHINGNPLDNRRCNLRVCTSAENLRNRRKKTATRSRFKGVTAVAGGKGTWIGQITHNSRRIHLGSFADEEEAARAYDKAALELFGEFALLNFPDDDK